MFFLYYTLETSRVIASEKKTKQNKTYRPFRAQTRN